MALTTEFKPLALEDLRREAAGLKADGWRFIQTHAVNGEAGVDLYYSFMKDGNALNLRIEGVTKDQPVPSITDIFLAAFVFENEARELFGVDMRDIAIDFHGTLYAPAEAEPMTFITPEQKAAREKALKAAAAKAAKASPSESSAPLDTGGQRVFVMTPELQARLDAKYPSLSDEKKAKVDAALKARAEEAAGAASTEGGAPGESACSAKSQGQADQQKYAAETKKDAADAALEAKLAAMPPEKAAKVRAALAAKAGESAPASAVAADADEEEPPAKQFADEQLESLINQLDDAKAAKVRAALAAKGGE